MHLIVLTRPPCGETEHVPQKINVLFKSAFEGLTSPVHIWHNSSEEFSMKAGANKIKYLYSSSMMTFERQQMCKI